MCGSITSSYRPRLQHDKYCIICSHGKNMTDNFSIHITEFDNIHTTNHFFNKISSNKRPVLNISGENTLRARKITKHMVFFANSCKLSVFSEHERIYQIYLKHLIQDTGFHMHGT